MFPWKEWFQFSWGIKGVCSSIFTSNSAIHYMVTSRYFTNMWVESLTINTLKKSSMLYRVSSKEICLLRDYLSPEYLYPILHQAHFTVFSWELWTNYFFFWVLTVFSDFLHSSLLFDFILLFYFIILFYITAF